MLDQLADLRKKVTIVSLSSGANGLRSFVKLALKLIYVIQEEMLIEANKILKRKVYHIYCV